MSYYININSSRRERRLWSRPVDVTDPSFIDLYDEISSNWQEKARKLRIRRMRKLKHQYE